MNRDEILNQLSPENLAVLGQQHIAYIKPALVDGKKVYEVHAADGAEIARFADRDIAFAACRQHELEPVSVH